MEPGWTTEVYGLKWTIATPARWRGASSLAAGFR